MFKHIIILSLAILFCSTNSFASNDFERVFVCERSDDEEFPFFVRITRSYSENSYKIASWSNSTHYKSSEPDINSGKIISVKTSKAGNFAEVDSKQWPQSWPIRGKFRIDLKSGNVHYITPHGYKSRNPWCQPSLFEW